MTRPGWDEYAAGIAQAVSVRGDCLRRRVGAVILGRDHRIVAAGFNGTYPGGPSCLNGECPRGTSDVPPGSSYDTGPGMCHASHAEQNALADVDDRSRLDGATMFTTAEPCGGCIRQVRNTTKISAIIWPDGRVALP